jgi:hypothetical protein
VKSAPDLQRFDLLKIKACRSKEHSSGEDTTGFYPRVQVDTAGTGVVSHAGGVPLTETVRTIGLDRLLSTALARWCKPLAVPHPGKVVCDLAVSLALGGDCLADVGMLRAESGLFGPVASASADDPVIVDVDATLVTAHSDKQGAAPSVKRGFGFHTLWAFVEHGDDSTGEYRPTSGHTAAADAWSLAALRVRQGEAMLNNVVDPLRRPLARLRSRLRLRLAQPSAR